MPYRRLPNTDLARLRALKAAIAKGMELPPTQLAFSQQTLSRVKLFLPGYEMSVNRYKQSFLDTNAKNKDYKNRFNRVKLYISHFIQVMNMAIARGEMKAQDRVFFSLMENDNCVPKLTTEEDVITWGKRVIEGENKRIAAGKVPMQNPNVANLRIWYDKFMEAYRSKETSKQTNSRVLNESTTQRDEADDIISTIWNEVEKHFSYLPPVKMRKEAATYGIVYVKRKNEIPDELSDSMSLPSLFNL